MATEQGTPQGGNLSPMLSNIFLHYVLDLWFEKRLKRQVRGVLPGAVCGRLRLHGAIPG